MKKTGWVIGSVVLAGAFFAFTVLSILNITNRQDGGALTAKDSLALCDYAIEAFCSGTYYTSRVLDQNVSYDTYDQWYDELSKAQQYYDAAAQCTKLLHEQVDDDTFQSMISAQNQQTFSFIETAYAAESNDIIQVFDSAQAGQRLRTLADFLNSDMQYANSALKTANGEITAEAWTNFGDVAASREVGARIVRSGCKVTVLIAAEMGIAPAIPFVIPKGIVSLGGAATAAQLTDDALYLFKGEAGYDNCTYTITSLQGNAVNYAKDGAKWLFLSDSNGNPAISAANATEDIRSLVLNDPFVGINLSKDGATMTSGNLDDAIAYAQALKDSEGLLDEIRALQNQLAASNTNTGTTTPSTPVSPDGTVSFDVSDLAGTWQMAWNVTPTAFGQPLNPNSKGPIRRLVVID